jgi:hypothetical protein
MRSARVQYRRIFVTLFFGVFLTSSGLEAFASVWPFDQRQILLAQTEGQLFPSDVTVAQILDVFVKRGRTQWVTEKAGTGQIKPVMIPKDFPWQSAPSVRALGLRYKVDGVVILGQKGTEIDLRWYSASDGQPLFFEKVHLPDAGPRAGEVEERKARLQGWLEEIWGRIPGAGYVVRRDLKTLSFEGASALGVKVGDSLEIRRLESVIRHPLLRTLTGIESTLSGTAVVSSVSNPLSVAEISFESETDPIQEGDRYVVKNVVGVTSSSGTSVPGKISGVTSEPATQRRLNPLFEGDRSQVGGQESDPLRARLLDLSARLGWVRSSFEETTVAQTTNVTPSGWSVDLAGRLYVTPQWIVDGRLAFHNLSEELVKSNTGNSANVGFGSSYFRVAPGFRFNLVPDPWVPGDLVISAGYSRFSVSVTAKDEPDALVSKSYSGLDIGLSLRMPVGEQFFMFGGGQRLLSTSLSESPITSGAYTSGSEWAFELGGGYALDADSWVSGGLETFSSSANFGGAGDRAIRAKSSSFSNSIVFAGFTRRL